MTEREKLIALLQEYTDDNNGGGSNHGRADYLLENDVVVLPCKVGDEVWSISKGDYCIIGEKTGWSYKIERWKFKYRLLDLYTFGEDLFLTKEEAEQALERRIDYEN